MSKFQHPISFTEAETLTNGKFEHPLSFSEVENLFKISSKDDKIFNTRMTRFLTCRSRTAKQAATCKARIVAQQSVDKQIGNQTV